jgi:hypothetical protein
MEDSDLNDDISFQNCFFFFAIFVYDFDLISRSL